MICSYLYRIFLLYKKIDLNTQYRFPPRLFKHQMYSPFSRNQIPIKNWLENHVATRSSELDATNVAKYLCLALANTSITQNPQEHQNYSNPQVKYQEQHGGSCQHKQEVEELWSKNQYFHQCLVEIGEEVIFYVYSYTWRTRLLQPKCLLGFYELVKNLVHYDDRYRENRQFKVPQCLKEFAEERLLRVLLMQWNFSAIKLSLTKLSDSLHTQLFIKQLLALIKNRFLNLQVLYKLKIPKGLLQNLVNMLAQQLEGKDECTLEIPIDHLFLCFTYATYKASKEKVLFSKIMQIYQETFEAVLNKTYLLKFYNEVYIMQKAFQVNGESTSIDRSPGGAAKVLGTPIKEERSIMQLFE